MVLPSDLHNPAGHSKSKRVTVEDPDESYVLGTRQRLLASLLFKQHGSAQDLPSAAPPTPPPPTTQPDHTPTTSVTSILCRAVKVKLPYRASDIMLCCNFNYKLEKMQNKKSNNFFLSNKVSYYPLYVTTKLCM